MVYAVQRYAASRPWAKRIGQLYAQAAQPSAARKEMKEVIKRELERAAQVFEVRQQTIVAELALAESWGCFARHGRVISHLDDALAQALAHTRLPSHLPDTLILPADAFFLHVPAGGGAFVVHQPERKVLLLTLVGADFSWRPRSGCKVRMASRRWRSATRASWRRRSRRWRSAGGPCWPRC